MANKHYNRNALRNSSKTLNPTGQGKPAPAIRDSQIHDVGYPGLPGPTQRRSRSKSSEKKPKQHAKELGLG